MQYTNIILCAWIKSLLSDSRFIIVDTVHGTPDHPLGYYCRLARQSSHFTSNKEHCIQKIVLTKYLLTVDTPLWRRPHVPLLHPCRDPSSPIIVMFPPAIFSNPTSTAPSLSQMSVSVSEVMSTSTSTTTNSRWSGRNTNQPTLLVHMELQNCKCPIVLPQSKWHKLSITVLKLLITKLSKDH